MWGQRRRGCCTAVSLMATAEFLFPVGKAMPPKRAAIDKKKLPLHQKVRSARRTDKVTREELRDIVCVPENGYPGGASKYTYVPGYCVMRDKDSVAASGRVAAGDRPTIAAEATRKEIKILEKVLDAFGKDYKDRPIGDMRVLLRVFDNMTSPKLRRKHPDPIERYKVEAHKAEQAFGVDYHLPKYTILKLVLTSIQNNTN